MTSRFSNYIVSELENPVPSTHREVQNMYVNASVIINKLKSSGVAKEEISPIIDWRDSLKEYGRKGLSPEQKKRFLASFRSLSYNRQVQ